MKLTATVKANFIFSIVILSCIVMFDVSNAQTAMPQEPATAPKVEAKKETPKKAKKTSKSSEKQGIRVTEIVISGNKKIEKDAILARLKTKVGSPYSTDTIREDITSIFKLGYFYDVQVDKQDVSGGVKITYKIIEKPSVVEIVYRGNDELTESDLKEAVELKAYQILDISTIQKAQEKISKLYEDKGFFLAKVSYKFETVGKDEDRVRLVFDIEENDKVKVKRINFIGNRKLTDNELKSMLQTKEQGLFSFISGSGAYKQETFDRDQQILSYLYFNKGYVQVKISKPQVTVSPDKKGIYIAIRIEEGEQFDVGDIEFQGDLLFTTLELSDTIKIDEESTFVAQTLQEDINKLQAKYGDLGYAYANIIPLTTVREKDRKVDIVFKFEKGNKVYFGNFNVVGNTRTRDKVVRREMEILEGDLYNETKKRESLANIRRLGFFDEITLNPKTPENNPDVMDLEINVTERNTGSIQIGAGYSSYSKTTFQGNIQQSNLFGRGQKLGFDVRYSDKESIFNINFTEPHFLDSEWSVGGDLYRLDRTVTDVYTQVKKGGALRLGHPLAPYLRGFLRYKNEETNVTLAPLTDALVFPVSTVNGRTSSLTFTLEYDKRDDRLTPTDGIYSNASVEYAGVGGDKKYTLTTTTFRYYKKIIWDLVWRNNVTYGILAHPQDRAAPYTELFLLGGANNLRGYQYSRVGKRVLDSTSKWVPFGGEQELFLNSEIEFPLISEAGIKGVVFYDIGDAQDDFNMANFRADYGFGFRWFSPIGPLRFEWGFPIGRRDDDKATNFEFSIGAPF
jgi:outer membrane protein insertion porin family